MNRIFPALLAFAILLCAAAFTDAGKPSDTEQMPAGEKVLFDQEVTVLRSDFKEVHFRVPDEAREPLEFFGRYKTSGGFNDDITFLALTQENYVRWFSQYDHEAIVKQEKKKEGEFRFSVQPGKTYYFVLYNFFSTVTNKKVKLTIVQSTSQTN